MSDAGKSDKEKKSGAAAGAQQGAGGQPAGGKQPEAAPPGHTGYQFFADGSTGGYSFGLGGSESAPAQLDSSLPDWFTSGTSQSLVSAAPSVVLPPSPVLPESPPLPSLGPLPGAPTAPEMPAIAGPAPAPAMAYVPDPTPAPSTQYVPDPTPAASTQYVPDPVPVASTQYVPDPVPVASTQYIPDPAPVPDLLSAYSAPHYPGLGLVPDVPTVPESEAAPAMEEPPPPAPVFTPVLDMSKAQDIMPVPVSAPNAAFTALPTPAPPPVPSAPSVPPQKRSSLYSLAASQEEHPPVIPQAPPPLAAVRHSPGAPRPVPLDLRFDPRFNQLALPHELSQTVERIFSLNDLDFNGFVDFDEIATMLQGEELTDSEKQFVQLIYQVGKKVVAERPVTDHSVVPVMSKEDFKLAFASVLKGVLPGMAASAQAAPKQQVQARPFRPTLYAEDDYPLGSIKAQAVKLGTMGDAYFAACLVSMIDLQPRSIMRMINNHGASYLITFPGLHGKSVEVMPPRAEEIMHYGLAEKYGYWYPLLEKAFGMYVAQQHKLASSLERSKDMSPRVAQAMEALTSAQTGSLIVADFQPTDLRARIMERLSKGKVAVAIASDAISQAATVAGTAPKPSKPYAVQGYDQAAGRMIVRGVGTVNTSNLDESVHKLTPEEFAHYFKIIYYEKDLNKTTSSFDLPKLSNSSNPWRKLPGE